MGEDEALIWEKYAATGSVQARNMLVEKYVNLVRYVAGRIFYASAVVNRDDMFSAGVVGLIDAVEKFDSTRNVKFITYAYTRIYGSIMDLIRGSEWTPRSVREKSARLEKACRTLAEKGNNDPADEEIAAEMGLNLDSYHEFTDSFCINELFSLDELFSAEDADAADKRAGNSQGFDRELIASIIDNFLPEREKNILSLYYYEEFTLKEIADTLGLTEARISQLHVAAIAKIKAQLLIANSPVVD